MVLPWNLFFATVLLKIFMTKRGISNLWIFVTNELRHEKKPDFCQCKNKDADQLCRYYTTDQRLTLVYMSA